MSSGIGSTRCSIHGMDLDPGIICPKCDAETKSMADAIQALAVSEVEVGEARPMTHEPPARHQNVRIVPGPWTTPPPIHCHVCARGHEPAMRSRELFRFLMTLWFAGLMLAFLWFVAHAGRQ